MVTPVFNPIHPSFCSSKFVFIQVTVLSPSLAVYTGVFDNILNLSYFRYSIANIAISAVQLLFALSGSPWGLLNTVVLIPISPASTFISFTNLFTRSFTFTSLHFNSPYFFTFNFRLSLNKSLYPK